MAGVDNRVYLIDFGLAQLFHDPTTHIHIPLTTGNSLVGTVRYASINSHMGIEQSRRDDVESLAYTLVYLINGKLPWQGIRSSQNTDHLGMILHRKRKLCKQGSNIIPALADFLHYTWSLAFEEKPDYICLHALIQKLAT
jgi:serine/threonine protein kinase